MTAETTTVESSSGHDADGDGRGTTDVGAWLLSLLTQVHPSWFGDIVGRLTQLLMDAEAQSMGRSGRRPDDQAKSQRDIEQAAATLVAKALVAGASTRMVAALIRSLRVEASSKAQISEITQTLRQQISAFRNRSLDFEPFPYVSIQGRSHRRLERGLARNVLTAVALGVGESGSLEMLGVSTLEGVSRGSWTDFLSSLHARGLSGVSLVVTDGHPSLKAAVAESMPGADFQRSRSHALRDVLAAVPKPARSLVGVLVSTIYSQPGALEVRVQHARVVEQLRERFPEAASKLAAAGAELLAFASFPKQDWARIWSVMPGESAGSVDIQHLDPNFFVVAARPPRRAGNGLAAVESVNGRAKVSGHVALVLQAVPEPLADLPNVDARLPRITSAEPAPRIAARENSSSLRAGSDKAAAAATIRIPAWLGTLPVIGVLAAAFAAHAINLFNFPRYELDEGTYMSSAWAILNNQITAYPYGYGHPPLGWIQIAAWTQLTGGFFTFGNAINGGRVLMLFYAVGSSLLLYVIARRMSGRRSIGLLAMVIFSFAPLSLYYQRQVFLDNIAVFWLLLSLYLIIASKSRLSYVVGAGLSFGFAVLSKETFVILVPIMIYALWLNITRYQRMFGLIIFTYAVLGLGSGLVLMAILKGELFPYAWHLPWDHHPHLSLLDTLAVQVQRSQMEGRFSDSWYTWIHADPLLMQLSIVATIFNLIVGIWKRNQLFLALAAVSYWALLLRGGVVFSFYIIALIPLVALNAALALHTIVNLLRRFARVERAYTLLVASIITSIMFSDLSHADNVFIEHPTSAQTQSMVWIRNHVSNDAVVVINSYLYLDLRQSGGEGVGDGATFPYAHVYWNVAYDPELRDGLLQNNWDRIDYIVADKEMLHDIATVGGQMTFIDTALQHSVLRQEFQSDGETVSIFQVVHKLPQPAIT